MPTRLANPSDPSYLSAGAEPAGRPRLSELCPGVGMQAGDPEVDGIESEQDRDEAERGDDRRTLFLPPVGHAGVQVDREDDPRDEGKGLFGVPAPVPAPGVLAPDGAADDP